MIAELSPRLLKAVDHALRGDWERAHVIVQDLDGHETANWIHAVVHRLEGDDGNARYWYGRCGRSLRPGLSPDAELHEIAAALGRPPA
jgi:hypothetical protein